MNTHNQSIIWSCALLFGLCGGQLFSAQAPKATQMAPSLHEAVSQKKRLADEQFSIDSSAPPTKKSKTEAQVEEPAVAKVQAPQVAEKAGISFARQHIYPEQLEFLKHYQVDEELAADLDKLFARSEIQQAFKTLYEHDYSFPSQTIAALTLSRSCNFSFFDRDKFYVFTHKDFPAWVFKIARSYGRIKQNLGRVWSAAFINNVAQKEGMKMLRAAKKRVYFASKPLKCQALQAIVLAPKIEAIRTPNIRMEEENFNNELAIVHEKMPALARDITIDVNTINGTIIDCEDWELTYEQFLEYCKTDFPDLKIAATHAAESRLDAAASEKEEKKEAVVSASA